MLIPATSFVFSALLRSTSESPCLYKWSFMFVQRFWQKQLAGRQNSATHSKGLCSPGHWNLGLGNCCWKTPGLCLISNVAQSPSQTVTWLQTNADFFSLGMNIMERSEVPGCSMVASQGQLRPTAISPYAGLRSPKLTGHQKLLIWTLCSKSNTSLSAARNKLIQLSLTFQAQPFSYNL